MTDKPFATALAWIEAHHAAGATEIGVTCNPIKRQLFLIADKERLIIDCRTQYETRVLRDILHDHIARLERSR